MDTTKIRLILEDAKCDLREIAEDLYLDTDLEEEYIFRILKVVRQLSNIELKYH